jgi:glycosyltransferase involved in cell wall biosynthesis
MKICHVIITLSILGGAQRMLVRLLMANPERAKNQLVIVLCQAGAWGEQLKSIGVTVHELDMHSFLDIPRILISLKKLISEFQPDIVQTWMYHADLLGGVAAHWAGCKNIIWGIRRTSLSLSDSKMTLIIMKICALLSNWLPKKIISVAEAGRIAHINAGYSASRMIVIGNGFDFDNLQASLQQRAEFREQYNLADTEIVIGCLGRFNHAKGQDNFVQAAALLCQKNSKIKFLMVGRDCDDSNLKLQDWINNYGIKDNFILLGERYDVPICLSGMDVFCMPSRTEGFPNALGEAMAMGLPCVATDVGDTRMLAGDTVTIVPSEDAEALASAVQKIIDMSHAQRTQMGQIAKQRVMSEFSMEKACEQFGRVYQELEPNKIY